MAYVVKYKIGDGPEQAAIVSGNTPHEARAALLKSKPNAKITKVTKGKKK